MLSLREQVPGAAFWGHEKLAMRGQATYGAVLSVGIGRENDGLTRLTKSCPSDHQIDNTVSKYWCEPGIKSVLGV